MAAVAYDLREHGPPVLAPAPANWDCRGCCAEPHRHGEQGNACPVRVGPAARSPQERLRVALGDWVLRDD